MSSALSRSDRTRRLAVRIFCLILASIMILDTIPWGVLPSDRPKQLLGRFTNVTGLWQGQWVMFAPRPSVDHFWLTADIYGSDGRRLETWSSPYWPSVAAWEKFVKFRFLNYFNRVSLPKNQFAAADLADYLSRTVGPLNAAGEHDPVRIELHCNDVQMVPPTDGQILPSEEVTWVTQSKWLQSIDPWESKQPADTQLSP